MRLYIIRHAWAEEPGPQWADDSQRPLTADGRKRFRKVVEALAERGFAPQVIATSPYVRARETADIIVRHLGRHTPALETVDALRCGSDLAAALKWTAGRNEDEVAWVGHMPDVAEMTALLKAAETAKGDATKEIARLADLLQAAQAETGKLRTEVKELGQTATASAQQTSSLQAEVARLTQLLETTRAEQAASALLWNGVDGAGFFGLLERDPEPKVRARAARVMNRHYLSPARLVRLRAALSRETDPAVRAAMEVTIRGQAAGARP